MVDKIEYNVPVSLSGLMEEGGALELESGDGYQPFRTYAFHHPASPADRIHYLSSYNFKYNVLTGAWEKPDTTRAAYQLAMETDWEGTIEWNLDFALKLSSAVRRAMAVRIDYTTGRTYWIFNTDGNENKELALGVGESSLMRWQGVSALSMMRFDVQNQSASGGARLAAQNSENLGIYLQANAPGNGSVVFGLPAASGAFLYSELQTAIGTSTAQPVYLISDGVVRGGITATGRWFERRIVGGAAEDRELVPLEAVFPMDPGRYYHTQYGVVPGTDVLAQDTQRAAPLLVSRTLSIDRIGINIAEGGVPGTTIHLSVYLPGANGLPGALLGTSGAQDGATAGTREIVLPAGIGMEPGHVWLVVGARGGSPTIQVLSGGGWVTGQNQYTGTVRIGYGGAFAGAAPPALFGTATVENQLPRILVRVA